MPIFEYLCKDCRQQFETLVNGSKEPECPTCGSRSLARQLSTFAVGSASPGGRGSGACGTCGDPRGPGACSLG